MVTLSFLFWSNEIQNSHLCANIYVQYQISQCVFSAHTLGVIRFTDSDTSQYHASIKFLLPYFFSFSKARAYTRRDYISTFECLYPRVAIHATCVIPAHHRTIARVCTLYRFNPHLVRFELYDHWGIYVLLHN